MKKIFFIFFVLKAINLIHVSSIKENEIIHLNSNRNRTMVHFIKCGSADSILIESIEIIIYNSNFLFNIRKQKKLIFNKK